MDFSWLSDSQAWIGLLTLIVLEIVLGIDNIIFISIISGKLPPAERPKARKVGLSVALLTRLALLLSITLVMKMSTPFVTIQGHGITGRDAVLIVGGLFLLWKSVREIHHKLEGEEEASSEIKAAAFGAIIAQIAIIDIVFSLDSVITAVGMVKQIEVMMLAVIISVGFMLAFSGAVSDFVEKHPTIKMLALSFLILIGITLVAEGTGAHVPKGYIYFAMAFSVVVEMLNIRMGRGKSKPIVLREQLPDGPDPRD